MSDLTLSLIIPLSPTQALDIIFVILFAAEMVMKIIVYGFFLDEGSYLRNAWNWLDMAIVAIGIAIEASPSGHASKSIRFLRVLRTFRALRPLRMIAWNPGMRVVVNALFQSIPPLGDVLVVCLLVYFIFGVIGVELMKGRFYSCQDGE